MRCSTWLSNAMHGEYLTMKSTKHSEKLLTKFEATFYSATTPFNPQHMINIWYIWSFSTKAKRQSNQWPVSRYYVSWIQLPEHFAAFSFSWKHWISKANIKTIDPTNVTNKILKDILVVVFSRRLRGTGHSLLIFIDYFKKVSYVYWKELTRFQMIVLVQQLPGLSTL